MHLSYSQKAFAIPIEPTHRSHASAWDTLGYAYHRLTQHQNAVASFQQAIRLFQELGIQLLEARSLARLADSLDALGDHDAARDSRRQALIIYDDLNHSGATELRKKLK